MYYVLLLLKIIVSISLLNVWLVQKDKPTKWRGGNAKNIMEEFKVYGLPESMCYIVGFLKVGLALLLIASIWVNVLEDYAASGLILLLSGSIVMHFKISDPLYKSFPAALFLVFCAVIFWF
jgi:preprotein translocase subunit SecG